MISGPKGRSLSSRGVRLELRDKVVTPGGELPYTIVNEERLPLMFGAGYGFEKRTVLVWRPLHIPQSFAAWGQRALPQTRTREMSAHVPRDLRPGRYRLTTSLRILDADGLPVRRHGRPVNMAVSCTFVIEQRPGSGGAIAAGLQ
jgi:hypothetical protein